MLVRSEMRAAIWPSTSSSLPLLPSRRGNSGPSGQLCQVSSAVWISRWMWVSSWTLSRSWALRASRMRRWVSLAAAMASSWLRADSPLASSREFSSSKIQPNKYQSIKSLLPTVVHSLRQPHYQSINYVLFFFFFFFDSLPTIRQLPHNIRSERGRKRLSDVGLGRSRHPTQKVGGEMSESIIELEFNQTGDSNCCFRFSISFPFFFALVQHRLHLDK